MNSWLFTLWGLVVLQRICELQIANENSRWIKQQGGVEVGKRHYPWMVAMHILFFISIAVEKLCLSVQSPSWWLFPLILFLAMQLLRLWCIRSLGHYWNTRIWILPNRSIQAKGPYRYLRHPNYLVVILEMLCFPLIFGAYFTAAFFSIVNLFFLLKIRIPTEERALLEWTNYNEKMGERKRFIPTMDE